RRLAEERAEQQRLEQERIEAERRLAEERAAQERLEQERAERERAEQERLEAERRIAEEQERLERERREAAEIAAAMDREIARIAEQDRAQQAARNAQEATPSPVDGNAPEGMGEGGGSDILTDALNEAIGSDIMDDALSAALADATGRPRAADIVRGDPRVVAAVPLTEQERVEFARAVNECWRMQQLSPEVAAVRMTLRFDMFPDGLPDPDSFVPAASSTTEAVTLQQAFEAGRRAVMHCARNGYDLPADKYAAWQMVELTFSSSGVEAN
ncbi:MAG: hypothetical protein Q4G36_13215, partial [Paracoccus sp. (in: a-proteobacteria)]|nr:hypothetical protein [Paracoccus sp. (in: a-proteobacteria)]